MFSIFQKKKEILLDCFTFLPTAYDYAPINYGIKYMPEWWKDTPKIDGDSITVKNCNALTEYYKTGIVIPSWFEVDLKIHKKNDPDDLYFTWSASNGDFITNESHPKSQYKGFSKNEGFNIKIKSPWLLKCKEDIKFNWTQPTWNMRDYMKYIHILPGVVDYKYQHYTNINMFAFNEEFEKHINIPPITPLVILHPMSDRKIKIKNHLVDKKEWNRITGVEDLIITDTDEQTISQYRKKKKIIDKVEQQGCPYAK